MGRPRSYSRGAGARFVAVFCGLAALSFILVMGLSLWVDLYRLFSDPREGDLFQVKNFDGVPEHLTLPIRMRNTGSIGTLIAGSSTARYLLENPLDRVRSSQTAKQLFRNQPVFSAALGGATVHMALDTIRHAINLYDVGEVIYVLNFDGLSARREVSGNHHPDQYDGKDTIRSYSGAVPMVWSVESLKDSIRTIIANAGGDTHGGARHSSAEESRQRWVDNLKNFLLPGKYTDFMMTDAEIRAVEDMARICKEKGAAFSVIVSPIHPAQMELVHRSGLFGEYVRHLAALAELSGRYGFPVVAFDIYKEPFSANYFDMPYTKGNDTRPAFVDGMHFNTAIGTELLRFLKAGDGIFGSGTGFRLRIDNVDEYVEQLRAHRESYVRNNTKLESLMNDIYSRRMSVRESAAAS